MKKIKYLKEVYDNNQLLRCSLIIRDKKHYKFINKFIYEKDLSENEIKLAGLIIEICKTIYDSNSNIAVPINDFHYDKLLEKYKKYHNEPFGRPTSSETYDFPKLAGTLDKCYYFDNWMDKVSKLNIFPIELSDKKDGNSIAVTLVRHGNKMKVEKATTRGNKEEGVNVTKIFKGYEFDNMKFDRIGLQFEFMIDKKSKEEFELMKGKTYKTLRSCSSALLTSMQYAKSYEELKELQKFMKLSLLNYDYEDNSDYESVVLQKITKSIPSINRLNKDIIYIDSDFTKKNALKKVFFNRIEKYINNKLDERDKLDYAIDGIVITLLNHKAVSELGRKNNINKYQIAYKFPETKKMTTVRHLVEKRGKFNYIGLLADVDTVLLNGTEHHLGQIHSLKKFKELDLRVGDEVYLKYSGDVIPFLYKEEGLKIGTGPKLKLPTICNLCGHQLHEMNSMLRCTNEECPGMINGKLTTFCERVGIENISGKRLEKVTELDRVNTPYDLLLITEEELRSIGINTEKTIQLYLREFNKVRKGIYDYQLLSGLSIDKLGRRASKTLLENISLTEMVLLPYAELYAKIISIPGHKEKKATLYTEGIIKNRELLQKLISIIKIKENKKIKVYDKKILVSGIRGDKELENHANKLGYGVSESAWKDVSILVIRDPSFKNKTKGKKAIKKNIPIMTLNEFMNYKGV